MTTIQTQRPSTGGPAPARPRVAPLLGPGFVAAIAYIDPGNVATNLTAGATAPNQPRLPRQGGRSK
ncbi:hypothetical protein ONA91_13865 [Micromonospora sp. DR5-3]|uniref:hypothetical protein n=1 Tax=Micromonospora sp. MP36 TaxID=2604468 RepID=UPI001CA300A2|nr:MULTISPECIES: hypothetical protein [unclassified Micromonospora]MCW3815541.1 hypothetical protein [Micromonospora sp. DR5-3]